MAKQTKPKENTSKTVPANDEEKGKTMPFTKKNYIIVLIGVALIALGMILMIGGGSDNPDVFNDKMFDFQHLTLAPILILVGFVVEIVAIFWKKK
ncbi:MAG: DUF3098 domain-containing protein [Bacteroidales bacterium]|nr:DUF3098 domain-containing protein [Bacteroidales bacterium]